MKKNTYIFEDYRDEAPEGVTIIIKDRREAESMFKRLIESGNKVFDLGSKKIVSPLERQGERIVTYGIYTDHHLPRLS